MQADASLSEALRTFFATLRQRPTLNLDVAERAQLLTDFQLTDQRLSFTLERHPHILGRRAADGVSSGHFLVAQHYVFDLAGTHLRRDTVIPQWFQASKAAAASDGHAVHC
jgi:hypothetical protein